MWKRENLKNHAKLFLKKYYWTAFAVCLVAILLGASMQSPTMLGKITPSSTPEVGTTIEMFRNTDGSVVQSILAPIRFILRSFWGIVSLGIGLLFVVLRVIVGNNIRVGRSRYFIHAIGGDNQFNYLFSTFKSGEWQSLTIKLLYLDIVIFLWSLLFIIPGIVKSYQYKFVPYILARNSSLSIKEAMAISTTMTDKDKVNLFVLDLSFLGWRILGSLLFGIGGFFVEPYPMATEATLYRLKEENPGILGE